MIKVLIGIAIGIFISTVGFGGLITAGDKVVQKGQEISREVTK
jgi:hypothetical protein